MDFEIASPPSDGITSCKWGSTSCSQLLLACSWDKSAYLYDVSSNVVCARIAEAGAVLDGIFANKSVVIAGLACCVKVVDVESLSSQVLGTHDGAVRCLAWCESMQSIVSGSWDGTVRFWESRSKSCSQVVVPKTMDDRVHALSCGDNLLVVATASKWVTEFDVRMLSNHIRQFESPLKFETRCLQLFPDCSGYALGSVEGRIALEYLDSSSQSRRYAFKCHRRLVNAAEVVFPVNAIAFHPRFGTFASGGCDGVVNFWDGANRKRLSLPMQYETSIAALDFNDTGTMLAIAASYTYEEGEKDHPPDAIIIKQVTDADVAPKSK